MVFDRVVVGYLLEIEKPLYGGQGLSSGALTCHSRVRVKI